MKSTKSPSDDDQTGRLERRILLTIGDTIIICIAGIVSPHKDIIDNRHGIADIIRAGTVGIQIQLPGRIKLIQSENMLIERQVSYNNP